MLWKAGEQISAAIGAILLAGLFIYRKVISPFLPPTCRFYPSCSAYAVQAVEKYGPFKGSWLAIKRVLRCHPLNPGGFDPLV